MIAIEERRKDQMVPGAGTRNSKRIKELGNPHSQLVSTDETGACLPQRTTILGHAGQWVQVPPRDLNRPLT